MMRRALTLALLVAACGGPIESAGNCTELLEATRMAVEEMPDGSLTGVPTAERGAAADEFYAEWESFIAEVEGRADKLIGPAIERGADMEALVCTQAVDEAKAVPVAQVFEDIAGELSGTTAP